jgi:hypothetical protein
MYLLVVAACSLGLHVLLARTSVNQWLAFGFTIPLFAVAGALAGAPSLPEQGLAVIVLFVAFSTGLAVRMMRQIVGALDDLSDGPGYLRADAVELVAELESLGFVPAPEGWHHVESQGWDLLAVAREHVTGLVVSGDAGPAMEFDSFLDNGRVLVTCSSGRDRTRPHVVRQVFPDATVVELLAEHQVGLELAESNGLVAATVSPSEVDALMLNEERAHGRSVLQRGALAIFGSLWRESRRAHLDLGSIADRPDAVAELVG